MANDQQTSRVAEAVLQNGHDRLFDLWIGVGRVHHNIIVIARPALLVQEAIHRHLMHPAIRREPGVGQIIADDGADVRLLLDEVGILGPA